MVYYNFWYLVSFCSAHLTLEENVYRRCFWSSYIQHLTLSDSKLLERCVRGATQNPNEAINSLVWVHSPKHKHHGVKIIRFAAASGVCHFHGGALSRNRVMERLAIPGGTHTKHSFSLKDRKRLQKADRQAPAKDKKRCQGQQLVRVRREEALREMEWSWRLLMILSFASNSKIVALWLLLTLQLYYSCLLLSFLSLMFRFSKRAFLPFEKRYLEKG